MKVTAKQTVWLSTPATALDLDPDNPQRFIEQIRLCEPGLDMSTCHWVKLGEADVIMTLTTRPEDIVAESIRSLQAAVEAADAQHEAKRNALLEQIGKLSALTWMGRRP